MDKTWNDWWIEQVEKNPITYPERLTQMWKMYGLGPGKKTCGECAHLITKRYGGDYFKCGLTKMTAGAGTDWRKSWLACGEFEECKP